MTMPSQCPHCGGDLGEASAGSVRASAPAAGSRWEALQESVAPPRSIADVMGSEDAVGPTWWLPPLVYLAYQGSTRAKARAVLDELASRRDELHYAVVEEQTDDVVGLTLQPWPLVDERGRLRFPISVDPMEVEVGSEDLAALLRADRRRWSRLGLLPGELVERNVHIGDAYAVALAERSSRSRAPVVVHGDQDERRYLGGLAARNGGPAVPVLDITWDAREAGKLAHYAAAAGVIPDELGAAPTAVAAVARETQARYMIGFASGMDPRDVQSLVPPPSGSEEGA